MLTAIWYVERFFRLNVDQVIGYIAEKLSVEKRYLEFMC
jgi:hypothetical protein